MGFFSIIKLLCLVDWLRTQIPIIQTFQVKIWTEYVNTVFMTTKPYYLSVFYACMEAGAIRVQKFKLKGIVVKIVLYLPMTNCKLTSPEMYHLRCQS